MSKRKWEPDRPYCPRCKEGKWTYEREMGICTDCGEELQEEWPRWAYVSHLAALGTLRAVGAVILFGPPLTAVGLIAKGLTTPGPLVTYETATIKVPTLTGVLLNAGNWVMLTLLVWLIVIGVAYGPRRI